MKVTNMVMMALLSSAITTASAFASPPPLSTAPIAGKETSCLDQKSISVVTQTLAKNASFALLAVDKNQLQFSASYIAEVEKQLDMLMESRPIISASDQIRMVRIEYQNKKERHFILLPFDGSKGFDWLEKLSGTVPKASNIVIMHIVIDNNKIKKAIDQAWQQVTGSNPDMVKLAASLQEVLLNMGNVEIISKPNHLKETYDNMLLTDAFLKEGLYDYASLSLQNVRMHLHSYIAVTKGKNHSQELKGLQLSVDILSEQLRQKRPSALKKAAEQTKSWLKLLKQHLSNEGGSDSNALISSR